MKKNICFLCSTVFSIGGIQRCVSIISNEFVKKGYNVHIICTDPKYKIDYDLYNLNNNIKITFIGRTIFEKFLFFWTAFLKKINRVNLMFEKNTSLLSFCYYKKNFIQNKKIIDYINKNNINITIGAGGNKSILLALLKKKLSSKIIGWQHSSCDSYFVDKNRYFYDQKYLFKAFLPNLNNYVVLTKTDCSWIEKNFNYKAVCIYNPKSFISIEKSKLDSKNFIAVGRYDKVKGFERLIDSFNIFSKLNNEWNLLIVGDGPLKLKLQDKIKFYNLENRIFLIPKTNDIKQYYLNSSAYLLSSFVEGLPMVLIEACECGLPIVTYDLPCCKEQFNECSLIIKNGDIYEYAKALEKIANNKELLKKMSLESIQNSKKYDINKIILDWEKIL